MDTKQKKIKVNRQWEVLLKKYLKRDEVWLILGTAVSVFGFILLKDMLGYRYFETKSVLCMAGIMNLCFTVGIIG
ncbi:MAG: sensor histidine kinase, partial [Lachnospiraceae bacterium]